MFHTRSQRIANTVVSEPVRTCSTIDQYSALVLSAPMQLERLIQTARDRLAVADQPPITLTCEQREVLQTDCLYRRFLHSEIGHHFPLCYTVATICTARFLADIILADRRQQPLVSSIASAINASIVIPSSHEHWLYHCAPRPSSTRRRRSLTDLSSISCDCPPDHLRAHARLGDIIDSVFAPHFTPPTTATAITADSANDTNQDDEYKEPDADDDLLYDHDGGGDG